MVLEHDAAHLLVEAVVSVVVVHLEGYVGVIAPVGIGLGAPTVPGELQLEGGRVVLHERVGPGAVRGARLSHHVKA